MSEIDKTNHIQLQDVYNLERQNADVDNKIIAAIDRLAAVVRASMQGACKSFGLTPLQLQLLIFVAEHRLDQTNVSLLAAEFMVTKATISDSIKSLVGKKFLEKKENPKDSRSYFLALTDSGKTLISQVEEYPISSRASVDQLSLREKSVVLKCLLELIVSNLQEGNIPIRSCITCNHYAKRRNAFFCMLLNQELPLSDLRLDCPEHDSDI